jgi:hypothetical protein
MIEINIAKLLNYADNNESLEFRGGNRIFL